MKYFGLSWDEIMWGTSWTNLVMLSATIPKYDTEDKEDTEKPAAGVVPDAPRVSDDELNKILKGK